MGDPTTVIEVFAELTCPFTHVGLRRFVAERDERGRDDVVLRVRAWPLELVNGEPLDPAFVADEVAAIRDQVAPDLFAGFDPSSFPATSLPAFALAAAAYRHDDRTGEAVSLALRDLLFERGEDVADPELLVALAARHGLTVTDADRDAAPSDYAEGVERHVSGSPHFFTPVGTFFCPALDISHDDAGRMQVRADPAGFDTFVAACFTR
jgi:predicted DsbA family dithiol-disulfide isomerase